MRTIKNCKKCPLHKNQKPLLDKVKKADIIFVGLSAKKIKNNEVPFSEETNSGKILKLIEEKIFPLKGCKTNLIKCLPLDENNKLRYPVEEEKECCIDNLYLEINSIKPKKIFLLGGIVSKFILGSKFEYFKEINKGNNIFIPIYHPSYIHIYKRKEIDKYIEKVAKLVS